MARGWESKAIESQQADAAEKSKQRSKITPEEAARRREQETLRLSRQNLLTQLERARDPRHRQMLEGAIADLQSKIDRLDRPGESRPAE